jgi:cell division protein FtsI/penicillin-binding protein 2
VNGSQQRVRRLRLIAVALFTLLAVGLFRIMVLDHDRWLAHSYANRWSFRDVPAMRGAITDRDGTPIVADQPALCVQLVYDEFRTTHPAGIAVDVARQLAPEQGLGCAGAAQVRAALNLALHTPVPRARVARTGLLRLGRLLGTPAAELGALRERLAEADGRTVGALLGAARAEGWRVELERRLAELVELDRMLMQATGSGLWPALDAASRDAAAMRRLLTPWPNVPHGLGAWVAVHAAELCGLRAGHAVERRLRIDPAEYPSLPLIVGRVTGAWESDDLAQRVDSLLEPMFAEVREQEELFGDPVSMQARERMADVARALVVGARIGRSGVEAAADARLAGRAGLRWVDRDRGARELRLWSALDAAPGEPVALTLDLGLQRIVEQVLAGSDAGARESALVLLDAASGELLAIAGRSERDGEPVAAPVATWWGGNGSLGSVAKPFVLLEWLAARRAGDAAATGLALAPCAQTFRRDGAGRRRLRCDAVHGAEGTDPIAALAKSCNVFFFQLGQALGRDGLARAYARFGLCPAPGPPDDRCHRGVDGLQPFAEPRLDLERQIVETAAIGYGAEAGAVSVARAYAALATGRLPELRIWRDGAAPAGVGLGLEPADLLLVHEGLRQCVTRGTARARPDRPDELAILTRFGVLAKTGTAGVDFRAPDGTTTERNNAWFAGWLPGRDGAALVFAAVAYGARDRMHGAEVAGALVARVFERIAGDPRLAERHLPEPR